MKSTPNGPTPALGEETIPKGEPAQIEELVRILLAVEDAKDRRRALALRTVHSKQHGCVRAALTVEAGLPSLFRRGMFREERTYAAVVRFSNSKQPDDRLPDAHGVAIKVLGVEGQKILEREPGAATQDFVLIDHPVFFVRNVADFIPLAHDFHRLMVGGPWDKGRSIVKAMFSRDYRFRLMRQTAAKRPGSLLDIRYWSTTPLQLGSAAMKLALWPRFDEPPVSGPSAKDKLRLGLVRHLQDRPADFDLMAQVQTDPIRMPIEDPTVEWDELAAPFYKIGTLRIPRQVFDTPEHRAIGENLAFTPWHSVGHCPLGGINRARRAIYQAMSEHRHARSQTNTREPTAAELAAQWPSTASDAG